MATVSLEWMLGLRGKGTVAGRQEKKERKRKKDQEETVLGSLWVSMKPDMPSLKFMLLWTKHHHGLH